MSTSGKTTFQAEGTADTEALNGVEEETQACVFQEQRSNVWSGISEVLGDRSR